MKLSLRKYAMLLTLAMLFLAPGLGALYCYQHPGILSAVKTNQGALLSPPVRVSQLQQINKWRLVLWSPRVCDQTCMRQLDQLARTRLALGRRLYEVDLWLLQPSTAQKPSSVLKTWLSDNDVHMNTISSKQMSSLSKTPQYYIMDPENYLILAYAMQTKPHAIYHDMKQLLSRS